MFTDMTLELVLMRIKLKQLKKIRHQIESKNKSQTKSINESPFLNDDLEFLKYVSFLNQLDQRIFFPK